MTIDVNLKGMDTCNSHHGLLNQVTYHIKHTIHCSGQGQVKETCIINNVLDTTLCDQVCH